MRVVNFSHRFWPSPGGSERYLLKLGLALRARGHDVSVCTSNASHVEALWRPERPLLDKAEETHEGIAIRRFPLRYFRLHRATRKLLSCLPGVPPYLRNPDSPWIPAMLNFARTTTEVWDLVHCTALPYDTVLFAAEALARRLDAPLVCTPFVHTGEPGSDRIARHYSRPHQMELLSRCRAVIVQTEGEREFLLRRGVSGERLHVIPQGLSREEVEGGDATRFRARFAAPGPLFAHVAPLCEDKGSLAVLEAFQHLQSRAPASLALLGPMTEPFARRLQRIPAPARQQVFHAEQMTTAERNDLLAACDALLLPSRTDSFGLVLLEAWSYGKPVVGAHAGGIADVVRDGTDGLLVPFGDVAALWDAMKTLADDPDLRARLGAAGRARLWETYDWEKIAPRLVNLFEDLAAGRAGDGR